MSLEVERRMLGRGGVLLFACVCVHMCVRVCGDSVDLGLNN